MKVLRSVLLLLAFGVLGLVGWRSVALRPSATAVASVPSAMPASFRTASFAAQAPVPPDAPPVAPAPDGAEFAGFYGRLRADLPHDYATTHERLARAGTLPAGDAAIWDALRDLEQSRGILVAQSQPAALDRFFDARSAVLDSMAPLDPRQCVDFLYGVSDASVIAFTAAHRGLVATLADRTLDAIVDGGTRHVDRPAPTEADLDALAGGLASRGLAPAEIGLLIDGTTPDPPLPDRRVCEIGRLYLDVIRGLPQDPRQRIYGLAALLLSRS